MSHQHRIFDSHLHIVDPRYPLRSNQGYLPDPFDCAHYLSRMRAFDLAGGAVVSGSFQGFDQSYLISALRELGPEFSGVTQLPVSTSDQQILRLHAAGVRAVRFNLYRGGSEGASHLAKMAERVWDLAGWHVELYAGAESLRELYPLIVSLPKVSIDHLGLQKKGLSLLQQLASKGVHVKASGFGRLDFDAVAAMSALYHSNPAALMFGSDLPGTRAPRPFAAADIDLIVAAVGAHGARAVLSENALNFYRPQTPI